VKYDDNDDHYCSNTDTSSYPRNDDQEDRVIGCHRT
jgi:hypothetical protein